MPENERNEAKETNGNKDNKNIKKLVAIALVIVVILSATGYYLANYVAVDADSNKEVNEQKKVEEEKKNEIGPTYKMGEFTVNFANDNKLKFLKANIVFELDSKEVLGEIDKKTPKIRDLIITTLRGQSFEDIKSPSAVEMKNDIKDTLNKNLEKGKIVSVWFTKLIIQ